FLRLFAVSLLVASTTIIDAGTNNLPQVQVDSSSDYKQGEVMPADQTAASSAEVSQESPTQGNPSQTNSGNYDPAQHSGSYGESQKQTPPVFTGKCTLTGDYVNNTDVSACNTIVIDSLRVPAGVQLNLTQLQDNAKIKFQGTSTFGPKLWSGPLVKVRGNNITVTGPGTLDGQGAWCWPQGRKVTKPVSFRILETNYSTFSGFKMLNMPYRTFNVWDSSYTTINGLTLNSSAGDGVAKNTDGFDLSRNNHLTITKNRIYNQDDCLAMQSSANTVYSDNYCSGSHGISIGSLGGPVLNSSYTVNGLKVTGNTIVNSTNGIRIKTTIDLQGLVTNAVYTNNQLVNVTNAIVMHSDYNKTKGGYSGKPTSLVAIKNIKINGLKGTATNLYDLLVTVKEKSQQQVYFLAIPFLRVLCSTRRRGREKIYVLLLLFFYCD
ncbi:polygalacturonase, partial [Phytophthora sojae]